MNGKVEVFSAVSGMVSVNIPDLHLRKEWAKKNAKNIIDFETLQEAIYQPGVDYMFQQGILYIKDMEVKKKLGLEPDDAEEPVNLIVLTDEQLEDYLTKRQAWEFKEIMQKMSREQRQNVVEYAVQHQLVDLKKADIIKEFTGTDILKAIQLKRQNEEEIKDNTQGG